MRASAPSFFERFDTLFRDCRVPTEEVSGLLFEVEEISGLWAARLRFDARSSPVPDLFDLASSVLRDRGFVEAASPREGWRALGRKDDARVSLLTRGNEALLAQSDMWCSLAGNLALAATLAIQSDVAFLHAASVSVDGSGVLITGEKARGKTTLSLALAARGHGLAGDELAALELSTRLMLPLRRALSIRSGPRSRALDEILSGLETHEEIYPDGTPRLRLHASEAFGRRAPAPVPLRTILFLREFADEPRIEPVSTAPEHVRQLQLHPTSLMLLSPARRFLALASILGGARCYWLSPGLPDETAELVLHTLRER